MGRQSGAKVIGECFGDVQSVRIMFTRHDYLAAFSEAITDLFN